MYRKFVDSFLPNKLTDSGRDLRADRIFINVLLISALADLLGIGLAYQLGLLTIALLLFTNALINLALLYLYKYGLSKTLAANFFLLQHAISFVMQAWHQGGLITPATAAYFLLPAVAILMLGKRSAMVWFAITVVMITAFYGYEVLYGAPISQFPDNQRSYLFFGSVLGTNVSLFILLLVYENNKNKAYELVEKKNAHLLATQKQLIQSEKMASLGELTAGIAHEIQNPLNFVNNFSEVNTELIDELKRELAGGNNQSVDEILNNLKTNLEKINHHGRRADGIVKGMLQHSRASSGHKELTDLNALCDEYLRLAYHGYRAKDKSFHAKFETEFDPTLPKINTLPQDMGRVILNLINNAFYAVHERAKLEPPASSFQPQVKVLTKNFQNGIEIRISDNGTGIPETVKEKIFQPFFTTKPTGQGTGLGLSLSYDIITKGHGGHIQVESAEHVGTSFIIGLPLK